ncbi:unnamed protein product, partial [Larinioides sclopetarius]
WLKIVVSISLGTRIISVPCIFVSVLFLIKLVLHKNLNG